MKKILIIAAAVLAFAGCAKEASQVERVTIDGKEYMTFKVVAHDDVVSADTKATLSRGGVFGWEDGDKVYFVDDSNNTAEGVFSESASTITVEAGSWKAASTAQFISKTQLNFNNVKGPVIAAQVSGGELHFHHVGSVINVKIADIPYDCTLVLWPNGDQKWGNGSFSFDGEGKPSLDSGSGNIYITKEVTPADEGKDIAISVPNLNYTSGFSVNLKKGDNIFLQKWTNTARDLSTRPTLLNMAQIESQSLTVAGNSAAIFGTAWAPTAVANDMELGSDGVWRKDYVVVPQSIAFKVALDHSWDASWGGEGADGNYEKTLTKGKCTVSFTFNGGIGVEEYDTYTVVGSEDLCGVSWERKDEADEWIATFVNDMEEVSSGVYYKKFTSVAAGDYEFKIAKNHSWGEAWPTSNFSLSTTATGDVEVFFYTANNFVRVAGYSDIYVVAGSESDIFNGETWNATADVNKMSIQNDGTYAISYSIPDDAKYEGDYTVYYKITRAGAWPDGKNKEIELSGDRGKTLTVYYNPVNDICSYLVN